MADNTHNNGGVGTPVINESLGNAIIGVPSVRSTDTSQKSQTPAYIIELPADAAIDDTAKSEAAPTSIAGPAVDITTFEMCFVKPVDANVSGPTNAMGAVAASAVQIVLPSGPHMPVTLQWLHQNKFLEKISIHKVVFLGGAAEPSISETYELCKAKIAKVLLNSERGAAITICYSALNVTIHAIKREDGTDAGNVAFAWDYALNTGGSMAG